MKKKLLKKLKDQLKASRDSKLHEFIQVFDSKFYLELSMYVNDAISTFIHEDEQGKHGSSWRYSKKKFKKDLKNYLIKGLV